ncbi:MAG TPA: hypothetical protein VLA84_12620, partial [Microcoleus sp.]|nr:hypothetical protein [Microcoleus sp.]
ARRRPELDRPETFVGKGLTVLLQMQNCSTKRVVLPLRADPTIQTESSVAVPNLCKFVTIP